MSEHAAVNFANEAFYLAFSTRDLEAMDALWARQAPVTCIHPGWSALTGRDAVMESWQAILTNPSSPVVDCRNPVAHLFGDVGYVICYEAHDQGVLIATNIFVREEGAWKMIHHQAGATSSVPEENGDWDPADTVQ